MFARLKSYEELVNEGWVVDEHDHDMLTPPGNIRPSNYRYKRAGDVIDIYQHKVNGKIEVYKWNRDRHDLFIWTTDMVEFIEDKFDAEDISIIV